MDERTANRQQNLLNAIAVYSATHGHPPTLRELMGLCDISSTSVVKYHLNSLRAAGLVNWRDGEARTLHLVSRKS
jgi:SOS-response transcriptional repressor LexA